MCHLRRKTPVLESSGGALEAEHHPARSESAMHEACSPALWLVLTCLPAQHGGLQWPDCGSHSGCRQQHLWTLHERAQ